MERMTVGVGMGLVGRMKTQLSRGVGQVGWEARRYAGAYTRRFGALGWGLLGCAVVAVLAWSVQLDQMTEASSLQARLTDRLVAIGRFPMAAPQTGSGFAAGGADARLRLRDFENYLLPHEDIPAVVQDLLSLAEGEGLVMPRGEYRPQIDAVGGFMRYRMSLPVKGAASAIHRFMQAALRAHKTLALQSVQFKRERIDSPDLEARIQWEVLTRLPKGTVGSMPPMDVDSGAAR